MPSSSRDYLSWRTPRQQQWTNDSSSSSGYSSATTASGGLYRNLPEGAPPAVAARKRVSDPSPPRGKKGRERDDEPQNVPRRNRVVERVQEYLPCFVKPHRCVIETAEELEVRLEEMSNREIWVRPLGFPSVALEEALERAKLVPVEKFTRAYPILVVTYEGQRKRGLIMTHDDSRVEYLNVDNGRVEEVSPLQVFVPGSALLAIPNAAIRCRLDRTGKELESMLSGYKETLSQWTRTRVHVLSWGVIPTVSLSIIEPDFDPEAMIVYKPKEKEHRIQKLYGTLPGIVIPPPFTILRNCSVLHVDEAIAYIVQNDTPFETDPSDCTGDQAITPSVRETEHMYLNGDLARAKRNNLEVRVMVEEEVNGSTVVVRSIDSGAIYEVRDCRELEPLLKREPSRAMRVLLPSDYFKIKSEELAVLLKTGTFDVFFENADDPPRVRLFTLQGLEMHVCFGGSVDFNAVTEDSEDDRSSTRSCFEAKDALYD